MVSLSNGKHTKSYSRQPFDEFLTLPTSRAPPPSRLVRYRRARSAGQAGMFLNRACPGGGPGWQLRRGGGGTKGGLWGSHSN